jgi:predicted ATPase
MFLEVHWVNGVVPGSFFAGQFFSHFAELLDSWAAADPGQLEYFGGRSLVSQSHGQSLMAFFQSRYRIPGLYLLDEPETALSPATQLRFARLVRDMAAAGHAQFLIASHSPIILACPGATIYNFNASPVAPIDYRQTEHYQVYKRFMEDPAGRMATEDE